MRLLATGCALRMRTAAIAQRAMYDKHLRVRRNCSRTVSGGYLVGVLVGGVSVMVATVLRSTDISDLPASGAVTVVTAVTTLGRGGLPL